MKEPGARLAITGYADKHLEGHPPLADEYNIEPSIRRGRAMLKVLREELGTVAAGVYVIMLVMVCTNSRVPLLRARDAVVGRGHGEPFIDRGEAVRFECKEGRYRPAG